jgi:hypothetical protein
METKFQTSFIPKKPLTAPVVSSRSGGVSIFMALSLLVFVLSLGGAGFAYGWEVYLKKQQVSYEADLKKSQEAFNPEEINQLKRIDTKIKKAQALMSTHLAVSDVFDIIGKLTAENIRFTSFDFATPSSDNKDGIKLTMRGVGSSFSAIAFQSDVFGQSSQYGRNKLLKNPVLSDLAVDDRGSVAFSFSATLNPVDLSYEKVLSATLQSEGVTASSSSITQ